MDAKLLTFLFLFYGASAEQTDIMCPRIIHVRRLMETWSVQDCVVDELSKVFGSLNDSCVKFNSTCAPGKEISDNQCSEITHINWLMETWPIQDCISGELRKIFDGLGKLCSAINSTCAEKPLDCQDILSQGRKTTGVYTIYPSPDHTGIKVRCDMDTIPGGWTVFQRRVSASDFYKTWKEYEDGFGDLKENFWLGNKNIHEITSHGSYRLRIDLINQRNNSSYAEYHSFSLSDAVSQYTLNVSGFSGPAGDSLDVHNGMKFSTKDMDNDQRLDGSCAQLTLGAWWFNKCLQSNLNGEYGNTDRWKGPVWNSWMGPFSPMKTTEMKMRRI